MVEALKDESEQSLTSIDLQFISKMYTFTNGYNEVSRIPCWRITGGKLVPQKREEGSYRSDGNKRDSVREVIVVNVNLTI